MDHERQLEFEEERSRLDAQRIRSDRLPFLLVLDGLQDGRNLGALLRLGDAARIQGVIAWQMAPALLNNKVKRISRSSWKTVPVWFEEEPEKFRARVGGYELVALEKTDQSICIWDTSWPAEIALVVGNEEKGISPWMLSQCRRSVHLPMFGLNTSMNVAMATGIATYEWLRKKPAPD